MSILQSINKARSLGADDEQILIEVLRQNPDKAEVINQARDRGANSSQIVSEIIKQNKPDQVKDERGFAERFVSGLGESLKQFADFPIGAGKGLLSTISGASELTQKALGFEEIKTLPKSFTEPTSPEQAFGKNVEQIAEFFIPGTQSVKAGKIVSGLSKVPTKLKPALGLTARAGTEAGIAGGISTVQAGEFDEDAKLAAIVGGIIPFAGSGFKKLKKLPKALGEKIQFSVIKPSLKDIKDGFKISTVNKFDLGGSLSETHVKTHSKINSLVNELQNKLEKSDELVDIQGVVDKTISHFEKSKAKDFGQRQGIKTVLEQLQKEVAEQGLTAGKANLVDATNIKRGAGTKGSWAFNNPEPNSNAIEKVYTKFYNILKSDIEKAAPKGLKEINKQISDLIPVSNAVIRRMPVEQRNNVISLTDSIGLFSSVFDPRALALVGAGRLAKSGKFGNFLSKLGQKKEVKSPILQRIFGTTR